MFCSSEFSDYWYSHSVFQSQSDVDVTVDDLTGSVIIALEVDSKLTFLLLEFGRMNTLETRSLPSCISNSSLSFDMKMI